MIYTVIQFQPNIVNIMFLIKAHPVIFNLLRQKLRNLCLVG